MPLVDKRYAEALVEIAQTANAIDEIRQQLTEVKDIYKSQQELRLLLNNPKVKIDAKKGVINSLFSKHVRPEVLKFLLLLIDNDRIKHLSGINDEFIKLADIKQNTLNMTIISATELDESHITKIKEKYRKIYNAARVRANIEIDKSLIGGIMLKIGDKVIDGSVKGRLESFKELLN